jgi:diguanylate cyclase (GGDEF)-like protein
MTCRHQRDLPDRRTDPARRKQVAEMTPDEMRRELLTDDLTGLNNGRWLRENQPRFSHIVAFDADSLKWVNDNMGHDSGDMLLKAWGTALQQATPNAARSGGDEFFALANSQAEAQAIASQVEKALSEAVITASTPDGEVTINGIGASFGIATDRKAADEALNKHKQSREDAGTRAGRGEQPPGTTRNVAQRQQNQVDQGGGTNDNAGQARNETLIALRKRESVLKRLKECLG